MGKLFSEEHKAKISASLKGRQLSEKHKERISASIKEFWSEPENQKRLRQAQRVAHRERGAPSPETKAKISAAMRAYFSDLRNRTRHCAIMKAYFTDPYNQNKINEWVRKSRQATCIKPTSAEQKLVDILEQNWPGEWKYVGDGQVIIGGCCPDFINTNGKKQIIEVFGTYWHDLFDVAKKKEHYRQYGFDTLVIWEDELADEEATLKKVKTFARKRGS